MTVTPYIPPEELARREAAADLELAVLEAMLPFAPMLASARMEVLLKQRDLALAEMDEKIFAMKRRSRPVDPAQTAAVQKAQAEVKIANEALATLRERLRIAEERIRTMERERERADEKDRPNWQGGAW